MQEWRDLVVGTLQIAPEIEVLVNVIGALLLLEVATMAVALLSGIKR